MFGATGERAFEPSAVRAPGADGVKAAQLDPITLHEGRHTFASLMIAAEVNAKAICEAMPSTSGASRSWTPRWQLYTPADFELDESDEDE